MSKKFSFSLLLSCVLLAAVSCNSGKVNYQTVENDPLKTQIYTLDNGLKVYMSVNKETPRIQTAIAVRVGGKNDPSETTGLAHYFEHLMFKGTESFGTQDYAAEKPLLDTLEQLFEVYRKTTDPAERTAQYAVIDSISFEASKYSIPNEYDKLMASIGAEGTNAYTSQDMTVYIEDIPSNQVENWAKIQSDRFQHAVIRGFHTELETVYEEKNMSLTQDNRKVFEALGAALFPNHPYGTQTVLGSQEHLKNPSITNIINYYRKWYVPNNMAICVSGDFDPDKMVEVIKKYFGGMKANPDLESQKLKIVEEQPITEPKLVDVYGPNSETVALGWRFPGDNGVNNLDTLQILSSVMSNGNTGVIDLNLSQQQKTLQAYCFANTQPDYSMFVLAGAPKQGQTLDQVKDLLLEQLENVKAGDFDDSLVVATIRNVKVMQLKKMDDNEYRVDEMINSFVYGIPWANKVSELDRISKITKQDVINYAKRHFSNNYVQVNKLMGKDNSAQKIEKPKITPINTNRDAVSSFLTEIQESAKNVQPIEPVFVDFNKDMETFKLDNGIEVLYKQNTENDLFSFRIMTNEGSNTNKYLETACDYFKYLGTDSLSASQIEKIQYDYATYFQAFVDSRKSGLSISGLNESFEPVFALALDKIKNVKGNEAVLSNYKSDVIKRLNNEKLDQKQCFTRLNAYIVYGSDNPYTFVPGPAEVAKLSSDFLLSQIKNVFLKEQMMLYYGPLSKEQLKEIINREYKVETPLAKVEEKIYKPVLTKESQVFVAPYDAKQIYMLSYSNTGEQYDTTRNAAVNMYNAYFGNGMSAIVFQEMREARGLAYTATASYRTPKRLSDTYYVLTFIATQNDKLIDATTAFNEILNNMPESEKAFNIAKDQLVSSMRTSRILKENVFNAYLAAKDLGLTESPDKALFNNLSGMTLEDVVKFQQNVIRDRDYYIGILGDKNELNLKALTPDKYGKITYLTLKDIFGY